MSVCPTCQTQREEGLPLCPLDGTPLSPSAGLVGLILGYEAVAGLLMVGTIVGILMALFLNNGGGA